ncbi:glycosyltransferase [Petralouisia muris]|uniref:Glycosyltransferase n=1 Tax=Petralouisia muris TaxID=3032872 RepID=A0AC61RPK8_9FIRM|nr:glycosyltransferase [Petralouisia muris]TGY90912.1 glycosyltransferase [Petralouisia muris]
MNRKKIAKAGAITGILLGISYVVLNFIAKLKKQNEMLDEDLQKNRYENAGEAAVKRNPGIYERKVKCVLDRGLSFFGLIFLSPFYAILSLAIYIDDPGPIFFKQKRVGKNKEYFMIHKFRSMKMSTPQDIPTHMLKEPEQYITHVGKFLRKYSLDELPQIWDIFVGNMSIIGPRPALWNQYDLVAERDKYGANDVKPGLTGWAQINGRDELEIDIKAKFDGEYVQKESFWFDVRCFLGTLVSVARHKGVVEGNKGDIHKNTIPVVEPGFRKPVNIDFSQHKKVLITGSNSYIGDYFKAYAQKRYNENFSIETIDMVDGSWRKKDFSSYDIVFHVAGLAHADVGKVDEATKKKYYEVNKDLAIATAEKAKNAGVGQFVFMSSMIVYGESAKYGKRKEITKYTKPNPTSFYGDSKWQADEGVRKLEDDKFAVLVLRPPMIYGKGSKGNYPILAKLAKKLPVFPEIDNERSMLYIDNLCEFLCLVMLVGKGGIFFPQNDRYTKTSDMVKQISDVSGKRLIKIPFLNPFVWVGAKIPGKIGGLVNKAFGNMIYAQEMSVYPGIEYRIVGVEDSIAYTEEKKTLNVKRGYLKEKPRALMLASVASMIDQFNMDNIQILLEIGYDVDVVANFVDGGTITTERVEDLKRKLETLGVSVYHVPIPRKISHIEEIVDAYKQVKKLCNERKYKMIHCHSPIGGVIARFAARKARHYGTKVIYTAHGFHFYKGAPIKNWLIFYPIEKICSKWTDVLISINNEDYKLAKERFYAKKVTYVPGVGIDTKKFRSNLIDIEAKRAELGVGTNDIMVLSVGELSQGKNHEIVIKALKKLNNPQMKYFICGKGELESYLIGLIKEFNLESQVKLLGYRTDVSELCQSADLFVFPSHQEGLPVALMEAIACQIPVICSNILGNRELVKSKGCLFDDNNVDSLVECLKRVGVTRKSINKMMKVSVKQNYENIRLFDLKGVSESMTTYYEWREVEHLKIQQKFKREIGISSDTIILLSVGELNVNKNHSIVIKALAKLKNNKIHYCIVGQGELCDDLKILSQKLGVEKHVHLLGYRDDVAELLRKVDVYVLPSIREGLNVSLMEAMASGLPCIVSDIRGNQDLIKEGRGGYRVKLQDEQGFCNAIRRYIKEENLNMGKYNLSIINKFSKRNVYLQMKNLYLEER